LNEKFLEEYMDQYRKMHNKESAIIIKSMVYIRTCMWLTHIKLRRQDWAGHICWMDGSRTPRKILEGNIYGS
jgi:hypothetical protein